MAFFVGSICYGLGRIGPIAQQEADQSGRHYEEATTWQALLSSNLPT